MPRVHGHPPLGKHRPLPAKPLFALVFAIPRVGLAGLAMQRPISSILRSVVSGLFLTFTENSAFGLSF
jgi:hypothetical protein